MEHALDAGLTLVGFGALCRATIIGHVGKEPETVTLENSTVANFTLAVNRQVKLGEGGHLSPNN